MTESDRQAGYDQIRERFLADPEFRSALRADPTATLEPILGELTEQEMKWVGTLPDASTSDDELVARVRTGVGAW